MAVTSFCCVFSPTRLRMLFFLSDSFVSYVGRNMLFYPIFKSLGFAFYVLPESHWHVNS